MFYYRVMCPEDADGVTNIVDHDQSSLIWVFPVWPDQSSQILKLITLSPTTFEKARLRKHLEEQLKQQQKQIKKQTVQTS